jgi:hypothetical protein
MGASVRSAAGLCRQKIEADPEQPRHIVTETGGGHRLLAA